VAKKLLVVLICVVFILGLIVGLRVLQNDFPPPRQTVPVEADLVHAYFKVYNVSAGSGVGSSSLVSYVVILNITNPSDTPLRLSEVRILSSMVDYHRDFGTINNDYYWSAHSSRQVAFSQTGPLSGTDALKFGSLDFIATVGLTVTEGRGGGSTVISKNSLPLTSIGQGEYIYGSTYGKGTYFDFNAEGISIGYSNIRINFP
jgi:hypothetical protein